MVSELGSLVEFQHLGRCLRLEYGAHVTLVIIGIKIGSSGRLRTFKLLKGAEVQLFVLLEALLYLLFELVADLFEDQLLSLEV